MADKSVGELIAAQSVTPTDLFVLEQNGTAKKLTGQILENWLVSFADGHGGIHSIEKLSTSGLVDTYRITLADTTTFDFAVTNGKGITGISKTSTSGLADTYTISYNDGTSGTFTVTNGAKGDKGDNAYVWIKYASQEPTESSHSMGDIPDDWIGIYSGNASTAPTDWKQYKWFKHKGEKGDTGAPATLVSTEIVYQSSDSGTIIPSGAWSTSIPVVAQGKYLWKRTTRKFNSGEPEISYDVNRMGIDGTGAVSSVAGVSPDPTGNVTLTAADVGALPVSGGTMTGAINMNGQPISGLNDPTEDTQAARKGYVDSAKEEANAYTDTAVRKAAPRNLLDNSDFTNLIAQAGIGGNHGTVAYAADRWILTTGTVSYDAGTGMTLNGTITQKLENAPTVAYPYVGMVSGTASISYADGAVTITSSGGVIQWSALYNGEYPADTLPEYQPKGYRAELAECQRYYNAITSRNAISIGNGMTYGSGNGRIFVATPTKMREIPTVVCETSKCRITTNGSQYTASALSVSSVMGNGVSVEVTAPNAPSNYTCALFLDRSTLFALSADL